MMYSHVHVLVHALCCRSRSTKGIRELVLDPVDHLLYVCAKSQDVVRKFIATVEQELDEELGPVKAAIVWRLHAVLRMSSSNQR